MKWLLTFISSGWDFSVSDGDAADWYMQDNNYPRLAWERLNSYGGGDGTSGNPYQIGSASHWQELMITPSDWDNSFILTADIDLAGVSLSPIGNDETRFIGILDGNQHVMSNPVIIAAYSGPGGLFGCTGPGAQIKNLCITNMNVTGHGYVGGLVGKNYSGSTITFCYTTGSVSGSSNVGGLIGENNGSIIYCRVIGSVSGTGDTVGGLAGFSRGIITACYANGSVKGSDWGVGGLVGYNSSGSITSSYANSAVSGKNYVGGLAGINSYGSIVTCYATGSVSGNSYIGGLIAQSNGGTIINSFWDIQTSGQTDGVGNQIPDPSGVIGLDTATMQTQSTFTSAGWDFTDIDGDAADWMMSREGEDYPRLAWQPIYPGDIAGLYGVDIADLTEVVNNWLEQDCPANCQQADIDNSGSVDLADLSILATDWIK